MPLTKARSVVLDIVDVSKSLKDNMIDAGIRDYIDEQIIDVNDDITSVATNVTALTATVSTINAAYFPKTGGTLTGSITINATAGEGISLSKSYPVLRINNTDDRFLSNTPNTILSSKQNVPVWSMSLGDGSPLVSGDPFNTGADFIIHSYDDNGVLQDSPIHIPRERSSPAFLNRELYIRNAYGDNHRAVLVLATARSSTGSSNRVISGTRLTAGDTGYKPLWDINLGDSYNGSGTNNSANFSISRYGDNGSLINSPLSINRSSGVVTFPNGIYSVGDVFIEGSGILFQPVSASSVGYASLTNGLILQWGVKHVPAAGREYVTLPVAFPNYIMNLQATIEGDWHNLTTDALVSAKIINNSQIRLTNGYGSSTVAIWWMALGR